MGFFSFCQKGLFVCSYVSRREILRISPLDPPELSSWNLKRDHKRGLPLCPRSKTQVPPPRVLSRIKEASCRSVEVEFEGVISFNISRFRSPITQQPLHSIVEAFSRTLVVLLDSLFPGNHFNPGKIAAKTYFHSVFRSDSTYYRNSLLRWVVPDRLGPKRTVNDRNRFVCLFFFNISLARALFILFCALRM